MKQYRIFSWRPRKYSNPYFVFWSNDRDSHFVVGYKPLGNVQIVSEIEEKVGSRPDSSHYQNIHFGVYKIVMIAHGVNRMLWSINSPNLWCFANFALYFQPVPFVSFCQNCLLHHSKRLCFPARPTRSTDHSREQPCISLSASVSLRLHILLSILFSPVCTMTADLFW